MALQTAPPIIQTLPDGNVQGVPNWARQDLLPGGKLSTDIVVPGLRELAGAKLSTSTKRNANTLLTNEPINTTVTASRWRKGYDLRQRPGDIIFVGDPKERHRRTDMETLSLPQLNTIARQQYRVSKDRAIDRYSGMVTEFSPQVELADPEIKTLLGNLAKWGEDIFNYRSLRENTHWTEKMHCTVGLSRKALLERWVRFLGVYVSDSGRGATYASRTHQTLNVQVGGPTRSQEVRNYWGDVDNGAFLGFILKRRKIESASTINKTVYGEFVLVPWSGHTAAPNFFDRIYFDDAGYIQYGHFVPIGQVIQQPLDISAKELREMAAGLTADESAVHEMHLETVMIDVDVRDRYRDLV